MTIYNVYYAKSLDDDYYYDDDNYHDQPQNDEETNQLCDMFDAMYCDINLAGKKSGDDDENFLITMYVEKNPFMVQGVTSSVIPHLRL